MSVTDSPARRPGSILGTRVTRTEDPDLLRGDGCYVGDLDIDALLHATFVRSEVACGALSAVGLDAARGAPGVIGVFDGRSIGVDPHHGFVKVHDDFARPPIAIDRVRFVGEIVALVVAQTRAAAVDGAALVVTDYDIETAVVDPHAALSDGATPVIARHGSNVAVSDLAPQAIDWDPADTKVVRGRYVNQRMAVVAMEPNCCVAVPGEGDDLTFYASTQMPHGLADQLAAALGVDRAGVRVVAPKVGGGFGGKAGVCAEYSAVAAAARQLGRPVSWVPSRSEDLVSLPHSRAQVQYAELACRPDGRFAGLRVRLLGDAGAYPGIGALLPSGTKRMGNGPYAFEDIQFDVVVATTNTVPTGAYRGAGRPEATALLERLVDQASHELGIDPIDLRRRNFIPRSAFPFTAHSGLVYDCGDFELPLDTVADAVGYDELRAEQRDRRARGDRCQLGIGVASYVEITAGGDTSELAAIEIHDDGSATVRAGTFSHGQGHQTAFAMLVNEATGIPVDRVRLVDGDTGALERGSGTGGSRSLQLGGSAVRAATLAMIERAKDVAARVLEADVADIVINAETGTIGVAGVPAQALTWGELSAAAPGELTAEEVFEQGQPSFPFGAHIAVVEVDLDTGESRLVRHVAVDDCGTVLNPLLVEGQQHGGIASGVGQALYEEVRFDDAGNPLTSTLVDYGIPTAAELPMFEARSTETPTPLNPLGAKGIGEASTIGSTPAIQNAIIDAVAHLGVRHLDMPCSPERVWRAIRHAEAGTLPDPWSDPPPIFDRLRAERDDKFGSASTGPGLDADQLDAAEGI